jgi:hypothetical protein
MQSHRDMRSAIGREQDRGMILRPRDDDGEGRWRNHGSTKFSTLLRQGYGGQAKVLGKLSWFAYGFGVVGLVFWFGIIRLVGVHGREPGPARVGRGGAGERVASRGRCRRFGACGGTRRWPGCGVGERWFCRNGAWRERPGQGRVGCWFGRWNRCLA